MPNNPTTDLGSRKLFVIKSNRRRESANSDHSAIQSAILRLSDKEYELLTMLRTDYPNINMELMGKPPNGFILFRSHFVADYKKDHPDMNQTELSKLAGIAWRGSSDSKKHPYLLRAVEAKSLWSSMYPNGHSESFAAIIKNLKKRAQVSSYQPYQKRTPASTSRRKKCKPLPSPPMSDDLDFQDTVMDELDACVGQEVLDVDAEYTPSPKECQQNSSSHYRPSIQHCPTVQLMTPESITRDLTPPTPTLSDFDEPLPPFPTFYCDMSLAQLNDSTPSIFSGSNFVSEQDAVTHLSCYFEQIAAGYNFEEYAGNMTMHWDQTDAVSNLDPAGFYYHPLYLADSYMTDLAGEQYPN